MEPDPLDPAPHTLRTYEPLAWTFHRGTARWLFNAAGGVSPHQLPGREHPGSPWTPLPSGIQDEASLSSAIAGRLSCRAFAPDAISLETLASVLRAAYGIERRSGGDQFALLDRPAPSAGGMYPLEVSLLVRAVDGLAPGVYHYVPAADGLECLRDGELPPTFVTYLFMGQHWVAAAAAVVVLSVVPARSLTKYGDRGYRYLLLEAGHVMQNVNLMGTALGLGSVNLGGFYDDELAGLLRIDPEVEFPVYAAAIGLPSEQTRGDRMRQRALGSALHPS